MPTSFLAITIYFYVFISNSRKSKASALRDMCQSNANTRKIAKDPILQPPRVRCALVSGAGVLPYSKKEKKTRKSVSNNLAFPSFFRSSPRFPRYPLIRPHGISGFFVRPSFIVLPTPDNSRKQTNCLSHLGLANNIRTPPGFFPSHASSLAATSLGFLQCKRTCGRVILAAPLQNQHLSSR